MDSSNIDSPALALFNPPAPKPGLKNRPITHVPKHFVTRSVHNLRQGNFALFVVFCGCFVIFARALFGAGYDEAYSADADAAVAKHPSLLQRWGPHSQHALEQQWKKLRGRGEAGASGLWAKIRKEDEGATSTHLHQRAPGADALHWLRVMEDKAMVGLGRRQSASTTEAVPEPTAPADAAVVPGGESPAQAAHVAPPAPEHDISEDLDEHDVPDEDDLRNLKKAAPPTQSSNSESQHAVPPDARPQEAQPESRSEEAHVAESEAPPSSSAASAPRQAPPAVEVDPEHDDTGDEPVYHSPESK
ncbi:hypothetical protein AURDEDRAFT_111375 [Auricularia subglabra TFB-10046 SS5]|nr:hypothetical protein AURDEDRAFT_111375 [Auricularia subglabra TFB-10046 SS5]